MNIKSFDSEVCDTYYVFASLETLANSSVALSLWYFSSLSQSFKQSAKWTELDSTQWVQTAADVNRQKASFPVLLNF